MPAASSACCHLHVAQRNLRRRCGPLLLPAILHRIALGILAPAEHAVGSRARKLQRLRRTVARKDCAPQSLLVRGAAGGAGVRRPRNDCAPQPLQVCAAPTPVARLPARPPNRGNKEQDGHGTRFKILFVDLDSCRFAAPLAKMTLQWRTALPLRGAAAAVARRLSAGSSGLLGGGSPPPCALVWIVPAVALAQLR
jgi:hypothetical protein